MDPHEAAQRRGGWVDALIRRRRVDGAPEPESPAPALAPPRDERDGRNGHASVLLAALQEMSARLKAEGSSRDLLSALAAQACRALPADLAFIRVLDAERRGWFIQGVHGVTDHRIGGLLGAFSVVPESFRALGPGSLAAFDLRTDPAPSLLSSAEYRELRELGVAHLLMLPLHHRGRLVGRLDLARLGDDGFTVEERVVGSVLAGLIASALDEQPAAPPDESDLVLAAAASFQQSIEPIGSVGEVLQSMVEAIRSVVGCDRCYGLLWHEPRGEFTPVAVSGIEPRLIGALKAIAFSPATVPALDRALSHPEPLLIADAAAGGQIPTELVETLGMRSAVIVPLRSQRNAVLAALMLDSVDPEHRFTALDLTILEQIAQHASVVVENALLYEAVKRSSDSLALVNEIGIDLASLTDVSRLVVQVYHHVASVIDAGRFCIGLLLPDGQTLEYWYAVDDYVADRPVIVALGDDPLSRVIRTRRRLLVNARQALDTSNWFPPLASLSPAESMLAVPLVVGHRVIGVLSVQSEFRGAYADHHLELLATIGMQTGVAIENARLYRMVQARGERRAYLLDQMLSRQEAERKTLVEDIHNDTLQTLASCLYRMDRMIRRVGQLTVEETQEELRQVRDELAENIARLRKVIFQLRPSTLDVLGFEAALKEYFKYLESETGIRASLDVEVDERPPSELETMIYRIVQEAVDNVRGRGGVTRVAVRVRQRSDKLVVTIADDGQQLDLATLDDTQPVQAISDAEMGLLTLKERAELAGGQMQVASRASGGATMQIILPYRSAS